MIKLKTKRVCNKCGTAAKIWHNKQWWCSIETLEGHFNLIGSCCKEKKDDS